MRHERLLAKNQRMSLQLKNIKRKGSQERREIKRQAKRIREAYSNG